MLFCWFSYFLQIWGLPWSIQSLHKHLSLWIGNCFSLKLIHILSDYHNKFVLSKYPLGDKIKVYDHSIGLLLWRPIMRMLTYLSLSSLWPTQVDPTTRKNTKIYTIWTWEKTHCVELQGEFHRHRFTTVKLLISRWISLKNFIKIYFYLKIIKSQEILLSLINSNFIKRKMGSFT